MAAGCERASDTDRHATGPRTAIATPAAADPDKRKALESMLSRGSVLVHLDARRAGVVVPPKYATEPQLVLRVSDALDPTIRDRVVDDNAISITLMFDGHPFHCVLPWSAVFAAIVEGEPNGTVWPDEVPAGLFGPRPPAKNDPRAGH